MEGFENQKALLEYLGRNSDDRKWVKRRMEEGLIWKEDGMFYLSDKIDWATYKGRAVVKKEKKSDLKEEVVDNKELEELKKKNEKLIEAYKSLVERYNFLLERCKEEQKKSEWDLCSHLIFFYRKFQEWKKFVDGKVFGQAEYNKTEGTQDTIETVKPEIYERYKFTYGEVEREECKIVEEIISQKEKEDTQLPF